MKFDQFTVVLLVLRPDAPRLDDAAAARLQDAHLAYLAELHEAGHLLAAGPLSDDGFRGLCLLTVGPDEAHRLTEQDPAVRAGVELAVDTTRNYLAYLNGVFLTAHVPAWSTKLTSKAAKSAKPFVTDSGLAAHVLGVDQDALRRVGNPALGGLVETYVFTELTKLRSITSEPFKIYYFRDRGGREIDFLLERFDGRIVAIEAKATASPSSRDAAHLRWLREQLGDRFAAGIVIHLGEVSASFGDRVQVLPLSALWGHADL